MRMTTRAENVIGTRKESMATASEEQQHKLRKEKDMDVYDFCALCTDDSTIIEIYDLNETVEAVVFKDEIREVFNSEWDGYEVLSFDLYEGRLTLNIDTSDDEEEDEE